MGRGLLVARTGYACELVEPSPSRTSDATECTAHTFCTRYASLPHTSQPKAEVRTVVSVGIKCARLVAADRLPKKTRCRQCNRPQPHVRPPWGSSGPSTLPSRSTLVQPVSPAIGIPAWASMSFREACYQSRYALCSHAKVAGLSFCMTNAWPSSL